MGFFEKRKFRNFLMFLAAYDPANPATYLKGIVYIRNINSFLNLFDSIISV